MKSLFTTQIKLSRKYKNLKTTEHAKLYNKLSDIRREQVQTVEKAHTLDQDKCRSENTILQFLTQTKQ